MAHNGDQWTIGNLPTQPMDQVSLGHPEYGIIGASFYESDHGDGNISGTHTGSYMPPSNGEEDAIHAGTVDSGSMASSLLHSSTYAMSQPIFALYGDTVENAAPIELLTPDLSQKSSPQHRLFLSNSVSSMVPVRHCRSHSVPETQGVRRNRYLTPEPQQQLPLGSTPCRRLVAAQTPVQGSPVPTRSYTAIAPNLAGLSQSEPLKRTWDEGYKEWPSAKRMRAIPLSPNIEVGEEDRLLLRLKDEEGLSWKQIQARFSGDKNKSHQVPALQMRYKRLRERLRVWTEGDIQALKLAHDYWLQSKYEIMASKASLPTFFSPGDCANLVP